MESKHRILVVDDDANVLDLMQKVLESSGFAVEAAAGGRDAIKKIEAARPDLVTLDLIMPDVDGWGVLAHLRRVPSPPPVLVVTGHPENVGPFSVMASVTAYIVKPFSTQELVSISRKIVTPRIPVPPGLEDRRDAARRMFIVQAQLLGADGKSLGNTHIVELGPSGARLDTSATFETGDALEIVFRLPGYKPLVRAKGLVTWRHETMAGMEFRDLDPEHELPLRDLVNPLGSPPR